MKDFVLDASIATAWFLPDEQNAVAYGVMADIASKMAYVPPGFWAEMRNVLLVAERRGRIASSLADASMDRLRRLPISSAADGPDPSILALSRRHRLTAYDAAYLELAVRHSYPPATADKAPASAALSEGVGLLR